MPKAKEARTLLQVADNVQFPYSVPSGAPPERLQPLPQAFVKVLRDISQ
jgi:hypothetical protein